MCTGVRSSSYGFLLLEAALSLVMVLLLGTLIFSWHSHLVKGYQNTSQTIQALYLARSLIEQIKAGRTPHYSKKLWHAVIDIRVDPLLPIRYISVSMSSQQAKPKKVPPLITIRTASRL